MKYRKLAFFLIVTFSFLGNTTAQFKSYNIYLCKQNNKSVFLPAKRSIGLGATNDSTLCNGFLAHGIDPNSKESVFTIINIENGIATDLLAGKDSFFAIHDYEVEETGEIAIIASRENSNQSDSIYFVLFDSTGVRVRNDKLPNLYYKYFDSADFIGVRGDAITAPYYLNKNGQHHIQVPPGNDVLYPFTDNGVAIIKNSTANQSSLIKQDGQPMTGTFDSIWFYTANIVVGITGTQSELINTSTGARLRFDSVKYVASCNDFLQARNKLKDHHRITRDFKDEVMKGTSSYNLDDVVSLYNENDFLIKGQSSGKAIWLPYSFSQQGFLTDSNSKPLILTGNIKPLYDGFFMYAATDSDSVVLKTTKTTLSDKIKIPRFMAGGRVFHLMNHSAVKYPAFVAEIGKERTNDTTLTLVLIRLDSLMGQPAVWSIKLPAIKYRFREYASDIMLFQDRNSVWRPADLKRLCETHWGETKSITGIFDSPGFDKLLEFSSLPPCGVKCTYACKKGDGDIIIDAEGKIIDNLPKKLSCVIE